MYEIDGEDITKLVAEFILEPMIFGSLTRLVSKVLLFEQNDVMYTEKSSIAPTRAGRLSDKKFGNYLPSFCYSPL